jgi:hypothetical protein
MTKLEEAFNNYTITKEETIINADGSVSHISTSPRGHYTGESITEFKDKLLSDDDFNKQWSFGCTSELTDDEIIEYCYKHIRPKQKWKRVNEKEYVRYFYYDEDSNIWFEHSTSDIYFGMRPYCPKRKIIE